MGELVVELQFYPVESQENSSRWKPACLNDILYSEIERQVCHL